jgi:hypothetical protein
MAQILPRLAGLWSVLLATAGNVESTQGYFERIPSAFPDYEKVLKEKWPERLTTDLELAWDVLGIGCKGAKPEVAFTIVYHYPTAAEAEQDISLFKRILTDNPSISSPVRLWSDKLDLQTTKRDGEVLIAQATARTDNIFETAITNSDFTFLSVRTVPHAVHATPTMISPAKAITSPYGSDWTLYTNERDGFAVALPPQWAQINLDPDMLEAGLKTWQDQNPDLPKDFGDQARRAAASGMKFMGFDMSSAGRRASFQVNVNVMRMDLPRAWSLDYAVSQIMQQLDNVATIAKPLQHQRVQLKAGEAEKLQLTQQLTLLSGQDLKVEGTQYYFVQGNSLYVLSLVAPTKYSQNYTELFQQITDSFQFVK